MKTKRNGSITSESFKWNMDRLQHLCFHVLEEWAGNAAVSFRILLNVLLRRKEPKSKISAWVKARLNFALIRSMLLCLRGTRTPSNVDNISKVDLCAVVAESNIEWITYRFIPRYFMVINMYGYILIWSLFRYFLSLYPVIRCYGTYFSCKISCMFQKKHLLEIFPFLCNNCWKMGNMRIETEIVNPCITLIIYANCNL